MALEFSSETLRKFEETVARYPKKEAAILPVLYLAQQEFGHLSPEAIEYVARLMEQSPARVQGVVSFYTIFRSAVHCHAPSAERNESPLLSSENWASTSGKPPPMGGLP